MGGSVIEENPLAGLLNSGKARKNSGILIGCRNLDRFLNQGEEFVIEGDVAVGVC
jgi:hypothetical protein